MIVLLCFPPASFVLGSAMHVVLELLGCFLALDSRHYQPLQTTPAQSLVSGTASQHMWSQQFQ